MLENIVHCFKCIIRNFHNTKKSYKTTICETNKLRMQKMKQSKSYIHFNAKLKVFKIFIDEMN